MSLDRNTHPLEHEAEAFHPDPYEGDTSRSNFVSFLIGGVVVAGGLFAFLFYDGGSFSNSRDSLPGAWSPTTQVPVTLPRIIEPERSENR